MRSDENIIRILKKLLLILLVWTFVAVMFSLKSSLNAFVRGRDFSYLESFILQGVSCFGWVLLTPLILWSAERFLPEGKNFYKKFSLLILSGIGIILLQTAYQALFLPLLGFPPHLKNDSFLSAYRNMFVLNWIFSVSLYIMTLGIILTVTYYRKYQSRELLSSKLEASLNRARLQLLQMQLHPHFLFNTHNAISELIHKDPDTAERMLTNLSDLLRISLNKLEVEEVSLQKELEFVEKYIEIEQMRFQERLKFETNITPETLDAVVPNMLLQPLIENAVKHGITPLKRGGTIKLSSYKIDDKLSIKVSDDGVGLAKSAGNPFTQGIGLSNTKARLLHLYKDDQSFEIDSDSGEGFTVLIKIPFTTNQNRKR